MKNLETAIKEAIKNYPLEEGEEVVIAYNNCSISLSLDYNRQVKVNVVLDNPVKIDEDVDYSKYVEEYTEES